jgi:hypothetical protein
MVLSLVNQSPTTPESVEIFVSFAPVIAMTRPAARCSSCVPAGWGLAAQNDVLTFN